jgi:hypothetical protein
MLLNPLGCTCLGSCRAHLPWTSPWPRIFYVRTLKNGLTPRLSHAAGMVWRGGGGGGGGGNDAMRTPHQVGQTCIESGWKGVKNRNGRAIGFHSHSRSVTL